MEGFRPNLAKTLKETPKEERRAVLDEAQNTEEYKNEKELNEFRKKLNRTPQEQKENITNELYPKINLSKEDWHSDEKVKGGMIKTHNRKRAFEILHNELIKNYGFEVEDISSKISPKIVEILEKGIATKEEIEELQSFLNKVTGGKYFDYRYGNHVFDAHYSSKIFSPENKKEESLTKLNSKILEKVDLKKFRQAEGSDFFLAFGKSTWVRNPNSELALFSSENPKFKEFLQHLLIGQIWNDLSEETRQKINKNEVSSEEIVKTALQIEHIQKDLKEIERKDENENLYYEVHFSEEKSKELLPLLMLEKLPIRLWNNDTTGGVSFARGLSGLEWLAKKLNVPSLKWIDVADTIVNLKEKKVYRIKQFDNEKIVKE